MAERTAAAGTLTIAMIMLPDRDDCGVNIDQGALVMVPRRLVNVMIVINANVRGMVCAGRNSVDMAAVVTRRGIGV